MSTLTLQTFRHLSRLARVYLGFALIGVVVGLICSVVVGPLTPTGQFSFIGLRLSLIGIIGLVLFCSVLVTLLPIAAFNLLLDRPKRQAVFHRVRNAFSILDAGTTRDNAAKNSRRVEAPSTK
jgi:hypothetical protein